MIFNFFFKGDKKAELGLWSGRRPTGAVFLLCWIFCNSKQGRPSTGRFFRSHFFYPFLPLFFPFPRSKWRGMRLWRRFCSMDSCARGPSTTRTSRGPAQRRGPAEGGLRWEATTPWSTWRRTCDPEKVFKNLYCCFTKIFMLRLVNMAMWTRTCDLKKSLGKNHFIVLYREIFTLNTKSWEIIFSCLYRKIFAAQ